VAESEPVPLILASSSPARRELLARLGRPFEVLPAHIAELQWSVSAKCRHSST
jgi:predicted house-cleaning NTP pyrophosphatase (Maf/HAM1 superfamily)